MEPSEQFRPIVDALNAINDYGNIYLLLIIRRVEPPRRVLGSSSRETVHGTDPFFARSPRSRSKIGSSGSPPVRSFPVPRPPNQLAQRFGAGKRQQLFGCKPISASRSASHASHRIASHRIASHRGSHRIASHRNERVPTLVRSHPRLLPVVRDARTVPCACEERARCVSSSERSPTKGILPAGNTTSALPLSLSRAAGPPHADARFQLKRPSTRV